MTETLARINDCQNEIRICCDERRKRGSTANSIAPIYPDDTDDIEDTDDPNYVDIRTTLGLEGSESNDWIYIKNVGEGGNGQVSLWARQDALGNVVERLAAKDCSWPPASDVGWYDGENEKRLREPYLHALLSSKDPHGSYTVLYRGSHTFESQNVVRMFLEFCPYVRPMCRKVLQTAWQPRGSASSSSSSSPSLRNSLRRVLTLLPIYIGTEICSTSWSGCSLVAIRQTPGPQSLRTYSDL